MWITNARVLYLDYDGVVHRQRAFKRRDGSISAMPGCRLFEYAELLEGLLEPYPRVDIVLSTSWAITFGFAKAKAFLPWGLRDRVMGGIFNRRLMNLTEFQQKARYQQIIEDVEKRHPWQWLAIDDDFGCISPLGMPNFFTTDLDVALGDVTVVERLRTRLREVFV